MYTIKRISNGDISGFESEEWTVSQNGVKPGKAFLEAVAFSRSPTPLSPEDQAVTLAELKEASAYERDAGIEIRGAEESTEATNGQAYQVAGVTVIRGGGYHNDDLVLVGAVPGGLEVMEALGVLITHKLNADKEQEVQYDFIYPGEQLYITDRFGNTVQSLR